MKGFKIKRIGYFVREISRLRGRILRVEGFEGFEMKRGGGEGEGGGEGDNNENKDGDEDEDKDEDNEREKKLKM